MFANCSVNQNQQCIEQWGVTTSRLSAKVTGCISIDRRSRNGSRRNKISSASPIWRSSKSLWHPTHGATEIDDSKVGWWIRLRLKRRTKSAFFLFILNRTTMPLLPYIYKIVHKLFSNNTSIWQILLIFVYWKFYIRKKIWQLSKVVKLHVYFCETNDKKIELQEYDRQCILVIAICDKKQLSNFALRYDKRKANRG